MGPKTKTKVEDPCARCREHHLKCDEGNPCKRCEKSGQDCQRATGAKFRTGSSAKYDKAFKKDQTWLGHTKRAQIEFVDQTTEVERSYVQDDGDEIQEEICPGGDYFIEMCTTPNTCKTCYKRFYISTISRTLFFLDQFHRS